MPGSSAFVAEPRAVYAYVGAFFAGVRDAGMMVNGRVGGCWSGASVSACRLFRGELRAPLKWYLSSSFLTTTAEEEPGPVEESAAPPNQKL